MRKIFSAGALIAILISGCAVYKPPAAYVFQNTQTYAEDYDVVWNRVIRWFAENSTPIKNMEKASGFISTEHNLDAGSYSQFCDCGKSGTYEILSDPVGNYNVLVQRVGDSTQVTVNTSFKTVKNSKDIYGKPLGSNTMTCNSTGKIERAILDYIARPS